MVLDAWYAASIPSPWAPEMYQWVSCTTPRHDIVTFPWSIAYGEYTTVVRIADQYNGFFEQDECVPEAVMFKTYAGDPLASGVARDAILRPATLAIADVVQKALEDAQTPAWIGDSGSVRPPGMPPARPPEAAANPAEDSSPRVPLLKPGCETRRSALRARFGRAFTP